MRLALVATPAPLPDMRPAPGFLDGDMIRARLPLADAGFVVTDLDPDVDLAEQLELLFERRDTPEGAAFFVYASCRVILSEDGELFLSLDPAQPDTGDSLRDLALLFREKARGPVAFFLECRHAPDPDDPFRSAAVVAAAKEGVAAAQGSVELLVAANPVAPDDLEDRGSALTRAFIEALDDPEAEYGLTLASFFASARETAEIAGAVRCFAHAKAAAPFEVLPQRPRPSTRPGSAPILPPMSGPQGRATNGASAELEDDLEAAPPAPAPLPPPPRAPFRSEAASIPVLLEDVAPAPPAPDAPRAPFRSIEISLSDAEVEVVAAPAPSPTAASRSAGPSVVERARPSTVPPPSGRAATAVAVLPEQRSFRKSDVPPPPRVMITTPRPSEPAPAPSRPPAAPAPEAAPAVASPPASSPEPMRRSAGSKGITSADHVALGNALKDAGDHEAALASYKRALGMLASAASVERAEIYVRLGQLKQVQDKRREAIANFDKALALFPPLVPGARAPMPAAQRAAMEARIDLNVAEGDLRAVAAAEDALLAALPDDDERFWRLVEFGTRWHEDARDPSRARGSFERARAIKEDEPTVLERLVKLYDEAGMTSEALATGRRAAELTRDPRERAERYFALGKRCINELRKDEAGLALFDLALESDPTMLEPLALVARVLADRQEWSQLEQAYRRMLNRVDAIADGPARRDVTFELCRRLGLLFRDHLEDPGLGLDAFEDAVHAKPKDLPMVLTTAELARSLGKYDRAAHHLAEAAALEPRRAATYHDLFDAFQKLRRPDQAFQAASVTVLLGKAESRERFIFDEHKPAGVPKPAYAMPAEGWEWLRPHDREIPAEAVLAAITPAAIAVRLASLAAEGRLPGLDPALRQDPERSTVSIVRSFSWASHFLAVPAPAVFLNDDPNLALAAVIAEDPTVMVGIKAQRGRSLTELAFLVGRHLAYHVGPHRLLLYYPSIEDLTACFLAAIRMVLPEVPAPPSLRGAVAELERGIALRISEANRVDLAAAVAAFEAGGSRVHLADWAADVERCATRAGFVLAADLEVAASVLRGEPRAVLEPEEKVSDLLAFAVSEEHHALRESLGIAIQP